MRLLDRLTKSGDRQQGTQLRIRPELNLDYPHADIESITRLDAGSYEIITTFFGLYGVSSPLPGYFTEELLDEEWEERHATRDFLDVIHQHIYPLLYRSWLKYRFAHNAVERDGERYWEIIYSVLGLPEEFREFGDLSGMFIKYAGLIAQRPRTMLGLKTILADYLSPMGVDIQPCVKRRVPIISEQRCALSRSHNVIGRNCVLGEQVVDRMGKYRVKIGPLSTEQFQKLVNRKKHMKFVRAVTGLFMVQPLECETVLFLEKGAARPVCLGDPAFSMLGQSTWLVDEANDMEFSVVLQQRNMQ